ncbi:ABC transporter permease subunit [Candidatus Saccharibacteria bacterium]|nr:ABC transporter permease subunit [Candidatus Saccharibacteria bacterium]
MNSVFTKTLREKRWFIVGWGVGLFVLAAVMVLFYPSLKGTDAMEQLAAQMPEALQGFLGDYKLLSHFDTYIASQLFDIRLTIVVGIMITILALGVSVSDEASGRMKTFISLPISRTKLFVQRWLAMVFIIAIELLVMVLSVLALQGTVDASIAVGELAKLYLMTLLVMVSMGSIMFAAGFAFGSRMIAMFVSVLVLLSGFILTSFGPAVDWLHDYEFLSLFYYFNPVEVVRNGFHTGNIVVLAAVALVTLVPAWLLFRRRDIR